MKGARMKTKKRCLPRIISSLFRRRGTLAVLASVLVLFPMSASGAAVDLAWDANTEPNLAGYKIYCGTASGTYSYSIDVGNTTEYTLTGLDEGVTYYLAATAYDQDDNESDLSEELVHTDRLNKPIADNAALNISNLSNASGVEYQIVEGLADGNACYIDRSYTYSNVPDFLQGAVYIKTANNDKRNMADPLLSFDVNTDVTVYVAFDNRSSIPAWLSDFTDTGYNLNNRCAIQYLRQRFPARQRHPGSQSQRKYVYGYYCQQYHAV